MVKKVIVLGAGISGLSFSWYLQKYYPHGYDITLIDPHPGGYIQTKHYDGHLFECGPHTLKLTSETAPLFYNLIHDLSLQGEVIFSSKLVKRRYIYRNKRLEEMKLMNFLSPREFPKIALPLIKDFFAPKTFREDLPVYDYIACKLNPYIAENYIDPFLTGIFAGNIHKLSTNATLPLLKTLERKHKSFLRAFFLRKKTSSASIYTQGLISFKSGMETLTKRLLQRVQATHISETCIAIDPYAKQIHTPKQTLPYDILISAIPAPKLAKISGLHTSIQQMASSFRTTSLAIVHISYSSVKKGSHGFGYLVPSKEQDPILGTIFTSDIFPAHNKTPQEVRFSVMIGGDHMRNFDTYEKKDFNILALEGLKKHLGLDIEPLHISCEIIKNSIPQYEVGHFDKVHQLEELLKVHHPDVQILGNHFYGISVPACIKQAEKRAKEWKSHVFS